MGPGATNGSPEDPHLVSRFSPFNKQLSKMVKTGLISAVCTPLEDDGSLHLQGLEAHLDAQWEHGISGLLVGGTMGLMQLQSNETYAQLIEHSARITKGRGEVLVGVGDTSFVRTRDRIELAQRHAIDGLVVVTPSFVKFTTAELIDYYKALADFARKPIFIYMLPALTGVTLGYETVLELSRHPNIRGIKCSVPWDWTRQLRELVDPSWRVIPAQPHLIDTLIHEGVEENLDGIFAVFPRLAAGAAHSARQGKWQAAADYQSRLSALWRLVTGKYPLFPACTAILNAVGVEGNVAPLPMRALPADERERLLAEPLVQQVIAEEVGSAVVR